MGFWTLQSDYSGLVSPKRSILNVVAPAITVSSFKATLFPCVEQICENFTGTSSNDVMEHPAGGFSSSNWPKTYGKSMKRY